MAAGRRQARQVVVAQTTATLLLTVVLLVQGLPAAFGALLGGGAATLGTVLMAWRAFHADVAGPAVALFGLFGGIALKWLVIVVALYVALGPLALPPLAVIAGIGAALAASLLAFRIKSPKVVS